MNWYTARCLFKSVHVRQRMIRKQLVEYRYILVRATDDRAAIIRASELARKKQHSYLNPQGVKVKWVLEKVVETSEILAKEITEGTDLYHRYAYRQRK